MIIGITGTFCAGKGTIVEYLQKKGFRHYSMSGYITEEIKRRGLEVNRDNMILVANDLRARHSPSFIAEELYKEAKKDGGDSIIESLRTVGEITALKGKGRFYLFAVDADRRIRYERSQSRKSDKDSVTFEKFCAQEDQEMTSTDPNKQNISKCIPLADFVFTNDGTVDGLHSQIDTVLKRLR